MKPLEFLEARAFTFSDAWLDQIQEHQSGMEPNVCLHAFATWALPDVKFMS